MLCFLKNKQIHFVTMKHLQLLSSVAVIENIDV